MPRWPNQAAPRDWRAILVDAEAIANSYTTAVTLRQLHYRLVASGVGNYVNTESCYMDLSKHTAKGRREGWFPALADRTRGVERPNSFNDPAEAVRWLARTYRRDRTEGQEYQVWVIFEKATLGAQIEEWTKDFSLPTAALRGYSSESLEREVFDQMDDDGRPVVGFYLGDLDPEGEDIERNFLDHAANAQIVFKSWLRLGVTPTQVTQLGLVPNPGKVGSTRAAGFVAKHGALFQVEAEAIDPVELERLVTDAIVDPALLDRSILAGVFAEETAERELLEAAAEPRPGGALEG